MSERLEFLNRDGFRNWLRGNCLFCAGACLLFGKQGAPKTITANEAPEEALWLD